MAARGGSKSSMCQRRGVAVPSCEWQVWKQKPEAGAGSEGHLNEEGQNEPVWAQRAEWEERSETKVGSKSEAPRVERGAARGGLPTDQRTKLRQSLRGRCKRRAQGEGKQERSQHVVASTWSQLGCQHVVAICGLFVNQDRHLERAARRAGHCRQAGVWRNGSASDSRSEGWEFESLCPHIFRPQN